jgi:hypothetical protein
MSSLSKERKKEAFKLKTKTNVKAGYYVSLSVGAGAQNLTVTEN